MKRLKLAVAALVIAAGIFGVFAFSDVNAETKKADEMLHWFDSETEDYLGFDTKDNIQANHCGPVGLLNCADGYEQIDGSGNPVDPIVDNTTKQ